MFKFLSVAIVVAAAMVAGCFASGPAQARGGFIETFFGAPRQEMASPPPVFLYRAPPPARLTVAQPRRAATARQAKPHRIARRHPAAHSLPQAKALAAIHRHPVTRRHPARTAEVEKLTIQKAVTKPEVARPTTAQEAIADIIHDDTLRPGDAYMAADGLRVYVGETRGTRARKSFMAKSFVTVARAGKLDPTLRSRLASLEQPRSHRSKPVAAAAPLQQRMTAIKAQASAPDRRITDARGRSIRLIGGVMAYAPMPGAR